MRLTTKGRYAVTALLDIALHDHLAPVALADIAERQSLSQPYLEQLFGRLKRAGLVASVRGRGGGYRLGRAPEAVNIADVVAAVGEGADATNCGGTEDCQDGEPCLTHVLWADLSMQIHLFLSRITLASLLRRADVLAVARRQDAANLIVARHL